MLKIKVSGLSKKVFPQFAFSVIIMFWYLPLPFISRSHTLSQNTCSGTLLLARISSAQISSTAHHTPSCILFLWLLPITLGEFSWIVPVSPQHSRFPTQYSIYLPPPLACDLLGIQQDLFFSLFSVSEPKLAPLPAISRFSQL